MPTRRAVFAAAASVLAAVLLPVRGAAAAPPDDVAWHARVDNDVVFGTDRWYSSGVHVSRSAPLSGRGPLASWFRGASTISQRVDLGLVHEVYTGVAGRAIARPDRPNAGRLFAFAARHDRSEATLSTLEVHAGVCGPFAQGEDVQKLVHEVVPAERTDWSTERDDRADVGLAAAFSHRIARAPGTLLVHAGGAAGSLQAFGHAGIEWRTRGAVTSGDALLRYAATPRAHGDASARGFAWFAGAGVRAVVRDRLLARRADDPRPAQDAERLVARVVAGVAWTGTRSALSLTLAQDSGTFEGQHRPHRFGALALSIAPRRN